MPDDATFEFSSDDEIRQLNEQIDKKNESLQKASKSTKNTIKHLTELDYLQKETSDAEVRLMKKRARGIASFSQGMSTFSPKVPNYLQGGLEPQTPWWRGQRGVSSARRQLGGGPGSLDEMDQISTRSDGPDYSPQEAGRGGTTLESNDQRSKLKRFSDGIGSAAANLAKFSPVVVAASAALGVAIASVEGAKDIRKGNAATAGEIAKVTARAAKELNLDQTRLTQQVTTSTDPQAALAFLNHRIAMRQSMGIGISSTDVNTAFRADSSGAASWEQINKMSGNFELQKLAGRPGLDQDTFAGKYTRVQRGSNAAAYQATQFTMDADWKGARTAMYDDAAWAIFSAQNPHAASLPGARSIRAWKTAAEARAMSDSYDGLGNFDQASNRQPLPQNVVRQPDIDLTSGGRGRPVINVQVNTRRPDPRSGNRPGD